MDTPEENRDFLLDLFYDIKSVEDAEEEMAMLLEKYEHIKEILEFKA